MLFKDERFGLFIHWGIYSLYGEHEQVQWRFHIPKEEYVKNVDRFNPTEYNPDEWVALAKEAGMEYICFTTKHHDGFCMWDTKYTDYNIMNTPYKKDVLKELADACERQGIKLCLYYSCPDWHHKNAINFGGNHQLFRPNPGDEPNEELYKEYIKNQLSELLTNYGKIDALFWDIPPEVKDKSVNAHARSLQPDMLINDRGYSSGDYSTPEREVPEGGIFTSPTEACESVSALAWGYRENDDFISNRLLMQNIDNIMTRGGNYLLNVGPAPTGKIPEVSANKIRVIGDWYNRVCESLKNVEFIQNPNIPYRMTASDSALYIHFDAIPESSGVLLKPIDVMPKSATVLNNGFELNKEVCYNPRFFTDGITDCPEYLHVNNIPVEEILSEPIIIKLEFGEDMEKVKQELLKNVSAAELEAYQKNIF